MSSSSSAAGNLRMPKMPKMGGFNFSNHFKNTNSILIVCVIILILIAIIGYKFSKCFSPCGFFSSSCNRETTPSSKSSEVESNSNTKSSFKIVTPQCVVGGLGAPGAPVIMVNVSEKMPCCGVESNEGRSLSKAKFEAISKANGGQIPKGLNGLFIVYGGVAAQPKTITMNFEKRSKCFWCSYAGLHVGVYIIN